MKKNINKEKSTNSFLKSFFDIEYNNNKLLFNNLENIYSLITFLSHNIEDLDIETPDLRYGTRKDLLEKLKIIEGFYKSMKIDFNIEDIVKNGTFNIISTNNSEEATFSEMYSGNNNYTVTEESYINPKTNQKEITYKEYHETINVNNNDLLTDSIIWVHEVSHYRNQPYKQRWEVNDILTELVAFTEELIYIDYLKKIGYEEEASMFAVADYNNFYYFLTRSYYIIRMVLLYYSLGEISKESYKMLYGKDKDYKKSLNIFFKEIQVDRRSIFTLLYYSVGAISMYNYIEYKKDPTFFNRVQELNTALLTNSTSLEESLKIINISLNEESLQRILDNINIFKEEIKKESKTKVLKRKQTQK